MKQSLIIASWQVNGSILANSTLFSRYDLIGDSERRDFFQETNDLINKKLTQSHGSALTPFLCVEESLTQRENGDVKTIVLDQLFYLIKENGLNKNILVVIAYESILAIGTGQTASPDQAQVVHSIIRHYVRGCIPFYLKISQYYSAAVFM